MILFKSRLLLAFFVTLQLHAQSPNSEDLAREAFKKGVEAFHKKEFDVSAQALTAVPELGGYLSLYKHWYLGQSLLNLGRYKDAEAEFAKVEISRASKELKYQAQFLHAEALFRQDKNREGVRRLMPLERKWRRSYRYPEVIYRLMVADLKLGHLQRVCSRARKLYAKYPAHSHVKSWGSQLNAVEVDGKKLPCGQSEKDFSQRIKNLQWAGESEKAHKEIIHLMAGAQENDKLRLDLLLANFLVGEGSVDDALNLLIRHYPQQKSNMNFLTLLARAAARSGEYQTAVGAYERAFSLSPRSKIGREALYQAAFLSYQFQDYDGAVRKFQKFVKVNPRSGLAKDAQWHLAWLQYLRSDFKGAISRFEKLSKNLKNKKYRQSSSLRDRLYYWMGMSYVRLKQFDQARVSFESITAHNPYSYYSFAAQARLANLPVPVAQKEKKRKLASAMLTTLESASVEEEEKESEEDLAEPREDEAESTADEVTVEDALEIAEFKDPAVRARIDVAQKLIDLELHELARWELFEVERHTRNQDYLRRLMSAYEVIGSYNRSASIAELSFARERETQGLEAGRSLWTSMYPQAFRQEVVTQSQEFGVAPEWIWSIMRAESVYKPDVISAVGARGLMQLMPYTARNLKRLGGEKKSEDPDLLNPGVNIQLGAQYLARLQQKFKGHLPLVAAAYNAGPHRVEGWLVNFGHLEADEFIEHIPFLETRNYVKKVVRNHTLYRRLYSKDQNLAEYLASALGVPIPSRASTRENWESL